MRPGQRRRGLRATARAVLTAAVGLVLAGGGGAVLHNNGVVVPAAFASEDHSR
ncbi:hypothetical protein GCM10009836_70800 [Pseudonocardia ailaonensis]|uniref:Uncharacterized protein n=2 Tax=Pseudonocardia ailaonensis TaxID=367279 RepID=A0ABN2NT65_9PSEU